MKKILLIIILFVFGIEIIAQSYRVGINHNVPIIPQGVSLSLLSGYGSSALYNDVSNIHSMNPASLGMFNKIEIGISYQLQTKDENFWISDTRTKKIKNFTPQSVGIIYPYNNFILGASMKQSYNREIVSDPIAVTTINNPDGEYFEAKYKTMINKYSIMASYTFIDIFINSDISIGLKTSLNHLHEYFNFYDLEIDENLFTSEFVIGAIFTSKQTEKKYLKFGIFYESEQNYDKKVKSNNSLAQIPDENVRGPLFYPTSEVIIIAQLPSNLRFDFDISLINNIKILGGVSQKYWSLISANSNNQIEIFGNLLYNYNNFIIPSIGFVSMDRKYENDYFNLNQKLNATYLNAGIAINYSNFNIHFIFSDSHILSGDWRKESIYKFNLNFSL